MPIATAPTLLAHAGQTVAAHGTDTGTLLFLTAVLAAGAGLLARSGKPVTSTVCLASLMAGTVHAVVAPGHFQEDARFGALFLALSVFQLALAVLLLRQPSAAVWTLGASVNLVVLAVWLVSRTAGLPFGPHPGIAESVGLLDAMSGVYELVVVAGCLWLGRDVPARSRAVTA
jgi:hypothetical protein